MESGSSSLTPLRLQCALHNLTLGGPNLTLGGPNLTLGGPYLTKSKVMQTTSL